jgi:uncharacterized HAD superfamily protein
MKDDDVDAPCCPPETFIAKYNAAFHDQARDEDILKQKAVKILNVKKKEMLGRKLSSLSPKERNELKHATNDFIRKSKPINPKIY